jgi:hypothetical protein
VKPTSLVARCQWQATLLAGIFDLPILFRILTICGKISRHDALVRFFCNGTICAKVKIAMKTKPLMLALTSAAVLLCGLNAMPVSAQPAVPPPMPAYQPLSDQQLDQLLGPIALYPDPLLAIILPAATLPTQIVLADRYVSGGGDPNLIGQQPWDGSVQALARYPAVLKYLDDNLAWTTEVGEAFLNQQQEVMESIQRLRLSAQNFGNLESTPQQQVVDEDGCVEILPADPDEIYVPVYQPDEVYFQSGFGLGFGVGCAIGPWLNCDFDWSHHGLRFWDRNHPRPANWWHEQPGQRAASLASQTTAWQPNARRGFVTASRGDRGWNNAVASGTQITSFQAQMNQARARQQQIQQQVQGQQRQIQERNAAIVNAERSAPVFRPESNGAFVGSESSRDVRTFSDRGQQSMQTITRSEPVRSEPPVSRPAPSFQGGGGGGGSHGSGSSRR